MNARLLSLLTLIVVSAFAWAAVPLAAAALQIADHLLYLGAAATALTLPIFVPALNRRIADLSRIDAAFWLARSVVFLIASIILSWLSSDPLLTGARWLFIHAFWRLNDAAWAPYLIRYWLARDTSRVLRA